MDKENKKELTALSERNMDSVRERSRNAYKSMNNIIFVVSSGAFVVTISFIGYLKTPIYYPWILLASWLFLFCSITLNFLAHFNTALSSNRAMKLINDQRLKNFPNGGRFNIIIENDKLIKKYQAYAKIINIMVLICLPLGILTLISFGWFNLIIQNKINIDINNKMRIDEVNKK